MRCAASILLLVSGCAAQTVRVGVFGLFRPAELTLRPAGGSVLIARAGDTTVILEGGQQARIELADAILKLATQERTVSAASVRVTAREGSTVDFYLGVPGRIERRFLGILDVTEARGALQSVVAMDLEVAVGSAVAAESPPGAGIEALKAQALASRSFLLAASGRHKGFEFCDTTHCQFLREPPVSGSPASVAASSTGACVLAYRGKPLAALYSASCGGRTYSLSEIGLPQKRNEYPFFAVECEHCRREAPKWENRFRVQDPGPGQPSGSVERFRIQIGRKLGWNMIPGNGYTLESDSARIVVRGRGAGHGVGLCQLGAAGMAANGASFREILSHFYPNTALTPWVTSDHE